MAEAKTPRRSRKPGKGMNTVSIRDLARNTSGVVSEVEKSQRIAVVTRRGAPVAAVVPIDAAELEDVILARSSELLRDLTAADEDLSAGRTRRAEDVFAELGA